jgi:hypothetical protein
MHVIASRAWNLVLGEEEAGVDPRQDGPDHDLERGDDARDQDVMRPKRKALIRGVTTSLVLSTAIC